MLYLGCNKRNEREEEGKKEKNTHKKKTRRHHAHLRGCFRVEWNWA